MESEDILAKLTKEQIQHFRVAIFGSARTAPEDKDYKLTYQLAKMLGKDGIDVITGGGPGIMLAGNEGHKAGDVNNNAYSIGLTVKLPKESSNAFLDRRQHFDRFSSRLDTFMSLSNVVVVMPGGIGTCLELFYTWQLIQVGHICNTPIILVGEMWETLMEWVKKELLAKKKISPEDMNNVICVKNEEDVFNIIKEAQKSFEAEGEDVCLNLEKYK